MRKFLLAAVFTGLLCSPALADLYQWKDEKGVIHITDSMEKVPAKYRGKVRVHKAGPRSEEAAPEADVQAPLAPDEKGEELYGDQTLEWWRQSFMKKREEISGLQASINTKTQFVEVYESGRRFGQIFDSESSARYRILKDELPGDLRRLAELREEYEEFQRKGMRAGVPKDIREP